MDKINDLLQASMHSGDSGKLATLLLHHLNVCKTIDSKSDRVFHLYSIYSMDLNLFHPEYIFNRFKWSINSVANLEESPLPRGQNRARS